MSTPKMYRSPAFFLLTENINHFLELDKEIINDFGIKKNYFKLYFNDQSGRERIKRDLLELKKNVKLLYVQSSILQKRSFDLESRIKEIKFPWKNVPIVTCNHIGEQPEWLKHNFPSLSEVRLFIRQTMAENKISFQEKVMQNIAS
jgi:hypothetical protein